LHGSVGAGLYFDFFSGASDSDTFTNNVVDHNHIGFYVNDLYPGATEPPTNNTLLGNIIFANNLPASRFLPLPLNSDGIYIGGSLGSNVTSNLIFNNPIGLEWGQNTPNGRNYVYNNFFSNPTNVLDPSQNVGGSFPNYFPRNLYNITRTHGTNIIRETSIGGNFWNDYSPSYVNGEGTNIPYMPGLDTLFCSPPFCLYQGGDYLPLLFPPPTSSTPDINGLILTPLPLVIPQDSSGILVNAIISRNGFAGTVTLSAKVSPAGTNAPSVSFSPSTISLTAGGTIASVLNVTNTVAPGAYSVTVTVQGPTTHTTTLQLIVTSTPMVSVVRGLDNGIYWSTFSYGWSSWQAMSGSTAAAPVMCSSEQGKVDMIIRGSDNVSIFHRSYSNGFWSAWDSPSGGTNDQPACASEGSFVNVVVRGTHNEIWYNYRNDTSGMWGTWQNLGGIAYGPPILIGSPSGARLDLVVQGADYGLWHKSFVNDQWSSSWDSLSGGTPSSPAAVSDGQMLHVVVRGTHDEIWYNALNFATSLWSGWNMLDGATQQTPSLTIGASGNLHLFVIGMNNGIYQKAKPSEGTWPSGWDSPGGATIYPIVVVAQGLDVHILVIGMDNNIDSSTLVGTSWLGWSRLGGETLSIPGLATL